MEFLGLYTRFKLYSVVQRFKNKALQFYVVLVHNKSICIYLGVDTRYYVVSNLVNI